MPVLCFDTVLSIPPFFVPFLVLYLTIHTLNLVRVSLHLYAIHTYIHTYILTSTACSLVDSLL